MVWLMKCPPRVAKAWIDESSSSYSSNPVPVAKYFGSVDSQLPDLSPESTMEMVGVELWKISKLYSLSKSKDIFSEANQGEVAVEGAVMHKVDMKPHCGIEEYAKICPERNRKQVAQDRQRQRQPKWTLKQIMQEINQPAKFVREIVEELCVYNARGHIYELKSEYKKTGDKDTTGTE